MVHTRRRSNVGLLSLFALQYDGQCPEAIATVNGSSKDAKAQALIGTAIADPPSRTLFVQLDTGLPVWPWGVVPVCGVAQWRRVCACDSCLCRVQGSRLPLTREHTAVHHTARPPTQVRHCTIKMTAYILSLRLSLGVSACHTWSISKLGANIYVRAGSQGQCVTALVRRKEWRSRRGARRQRRGILCTDANPIRSTREV